MKAYHLSGGNRSHCISRPIAFIIMQRKETLSNSGEQPMLITRAGASHWSPNRSGCRSKCILVEPSRRHHA